MIRTCKTCGAYMTLDTRSGRYKWMCDKCGGYSEQDPPYCARCKGGESFEQCKRCSELYEEGEEHEDVFEADEHE